MSLPRDSIWGDRIPPATDERVVAEFPADRMAYIRGHLALAVIGGLVAGIALLAIGNAHPWVGPVAALLGIAARAAFLAPEALAGHWILTEKRLLGPGGRVVPLSAIRRIRPFLGDVMISTKAGDKHLMKYMADPATLIATVERQRARA